MFDAYHTTMLNFSKAGTQSIRSNMAENAARIVGAKVKRTCRGLLTADSPAHSFRQSSYSTIALRRVHHFCAGASRAHRIQ
jgi:hypothetical protein